MTELETAADDYPSLGPPLDFLRLVWAVDHSLQRASVGMQRTIGVTGPQRLVIRIVGRFPGISLGRLARLLGAHPSTTTGLAKRLVRNGLVRTRSDPRDARRVLLGLTAKGRTVELATAGTIEQAVAELLAHQPPEAVMATWTVLESFRELLESRPTDRRSP